MANTKAVHELLNVLGLKSPQAEVASATIASADQLEAPEFDAQAVAELKILLRRDPDRIMAAAPALLGPSPTITDVAKLLDAAESALQTPELSLAQFDANWSEESFELPPEYQFEGYNTAEIPIYPKQRKFEQFADAPSWAVTAAAAIKFRMTHAKPDFPSHTTSNTGFVYPLVTHGDEATVALFADWGTGYYHSQYIAKHIGRLGPGQAIHLGDVYYIGGSDEFDKRFSPFLEKYITSRIPFFALNANHEMDTHGISYFKYLKDKRQAGGQGGRVAQPQEGSYFALVSDHYQIIGIDTAYFKNGRFRDPTTVNWLNRILSDGKSQKKINILLSQNEPFQEHSTKLLQDLKAMVDQRLIDLWFWGDQHYCALYPPGPTTPFGGSCIGHGGFPYYRLDQKDFNRHLVRPIYAEVEPRFPQALDLRPGMGNNGFCTLDLKPDSLQISYIDWRAQPQRSIALPVSEGRLHW